MGLHDVNRPSIRNPVECLAAAGISMGLQLCNPFIALLPGDAFVIVGFQKCFSNQCKCLLMDSAQLASQ